MMIGIKRAVTQKYPNGDVDVTVTPPVWSGFNASTIRLTADQYNRLQVWLNVPGKLIQDVFPDMSATQREILQTGIGPEEWDAAFKDDDDE